MLTLNKIRDRIRLNLQQQFARSWFTPCTPSDTRRRRTYSNKVNDSTMWKNHVPESSYPKTSHKHNRIRRITSLATSFGSNYSGERMINVRTLFLLSALSVAHYKELSKARRVSRNVYYIACWLEPNWIIMIWAQLIGAQLQFLIVEAWTTLKTMVWTAHVTISPHPSTVNWTLCSRHPFPALDISSASLLDISTVTNRLIPFGNKTAKLRQGNDRLPNNSRWSRLLPPGIKDNDSRLLNPDSRCI